MAEANPQIDRGRDLTVRRLTDVSLYPQSAGALTLASAIVALLLVLTGANLANLLLVRGIARGGEVAVRRALGAGVARIGRLFLVESLCLSLVGGLAGMGLAHVALGVLPLAPLPPPFSSTLDLSIDTRAAAFAVTLVVVTGLLFGLAPALRAGSGDIAATLRDDQRTSTVGRGTMRLRNGLIVIQVAGSVVLVMAAGLLGRTLVALQRIEPGVDPERVAYVRPNFTRSGLPSADVPVALEEMRRRIAALPGVTHAAAALRLPAERSGTTSTIVEGHRPAAGGDEVELNYVNVSPEYLDTVGLRVLEGRGFQTSDLAASDRVVLVNQAAARRYWPGRSAVGGRMRSTARNAPMRTVVGVVEDAPVAAFPEVPVRPMFYVTSAQSPLGSGYLLARTDHEPAALVNAMRGVVADVRPTVTVQSQGTLASHFGAALAQPRFLAGVMSAVSLLAVVLAGLGIYAVVAFSVARRSGEMGIRMALGATAGQLVRMVVGETVVTVSIGLAVGVVIAALAVRQLKALLFGVEPLDPATFAGSVVVLIAVAWLAAYWPARRGATADPARAFRN
jgi:predicted permease